MAQSSKAMAADKPNTPTKEDRVRALPVDKKEQYEEELNQRIADREKHLLEIENQIEAAHEELDTFKATRDKEIQAVEDYFRSEEDRLRKDHEERARALHQEFSAAERGKLDHLDSLERHLTRVREAVKQAETKK